MRRVAAITVLSSDWAYATPDDQRLYDSTAKDRGLDLTTGELGGGAVKNALMVRYEGDDEPVSFDVSDSVWTAGKTGCLREGPWEHQLCYLLDLDDPCIPAASG